MSGTTSLNLTNLQARSNAADAAYGLPIGTTYAIAGTESSYGTNLGTTGNIFQIKAPTAAQPGYGLGSLDGNDPNSAAAYFSAIGYNNPNSPGYQNLAVSYQLYQNGPGSNLSIPAQYSATSPFAQFLASLGPSGTTTPNDTNSSAPPVTTGSQLPDAGGILPGPLTGFDTNSGQFLGATGKPVGPPDPYPSWFPGWLRVGGGAFAVLLIIIGIIALVFLSKSSPLRKAA